MAVAKESTVDAAAVFFPHIQRGAMKATEGFSQWKTYFHLTPEWLFLREFSQTLRHTAAHHVVVTHVKGRRWQ